MARRAHLRASDADREHVAERLRAAAAEGRILTHELEHRLGRALTARTYGELDGLVADLPRGQVVRTQRPGSIATRAVMGAATVVAVAVVAIVALLMALWLISGAFVLWLVWLAVSWGVFGRRVRWPRVRRVRGRPPTHFWA